MSNIIPIVKDSQEIQFSELRESWKLHPKLKELVPYIKFTGGKDIDTLLNTEINLPLPLSDDLRALLVAVQIELLERLHVEVIGKKDLSKDLKTEFVKNSSSRYYLRKSIAFILQEHNEPMIANNLISKIKEEIVFKSFYSENEIDMFLKNILSIDITYKNKFWDTVSRGLFQYKMEILS